MVVNKMTMRTLWAKLRKKNKKDYRQFQFCILFAVMLISSYTILMFSPLIQKSLPDGGDTGKQAYLIFGIAVLGCTIFVWYATRLFLRYKSREIGVFMALGAQKGTLAGALAAEMAKMILVYTLEGIAAGAVLALIAAKILEAVTASVNNVRFAFTLNGLLLSLGYGVVLMLLIAAQTWSFMRRTNIMEVINEQRRQETMKKGVSGSYLIFGIILAFAGIFVAYILPQFTARQLGIFLGGWTNVFYLVTVIGIYRILVYTVSSHQRGRNPQKYYDNVLHYGMLKFQGASVVKNMLVIVLLIIGGLYAVYYVPMQMMSAVDQNGRYEAEYSVRYLQDSQEPDQSETEALASQFGVEVNDYREAEFIRVTGSGVERDMDENNLLKEDYYEKYAEYDCTSAAEYEKLSGIRLDIPKGEYYLIQYENSLESTWYRYDDMDRLYAEASGKYLEMKYAGNTVFNAGVFTSNGMDFGSRFVLNNEDYETLKEGISENKLETQAVFDTEGSRETEFATAFYKEFAERMSDDMNVMGYYNSWKEERVGKEAYADMAADAVVNPDQPAQETDWQYEPIIVPLREQQMLMRNAIRMTLFAYVFLICMAAVGVIGYTRSQSVGIGNAQVFEDIKRLGADRGYRVWLLKKQIKNIYLLPTVIGTVGAVLYELFILLGNDGVIQSYEIITLGISLVLALLTGGYQYLLYRKSLNKAGELLGLSGRQQTGSK